MITSMRLLSQLSINSIAKSLTGFGNTQKGVYFFAGIWSLSQRKLLTFHFWLILSMKALLPRS